MKWYKEEPDSKGYFWLTQNRGIINRWRLQLYYVKSSSVCFRMSGAVCMILYCGISKIQVYSSQLSLFTALSMGLGDETPFTLVELPCILLCCTVGCRFILLMLYPWQVAIEPIPQQPPWLMGIRCRQNQAGCCDSDSWPCQHSLHWGQTGQVAQGHMGHGHRHSCCWVKSELAHPARLPACRRLDTRQWQIRDSEGAPLIVLRAEHRLTVEGNRHIPFPCRLILTWLCHSLCYLISIWSQSSDI